MISTRAHWPESGRPLSIELGISYVSAPSVVRSTRFLTFTKERRDGKPMYRITIQDPQLKRQNVNAFLPLIKDTSGKVLSPYVIPGVKDASCRRMEY